MAVQESSWKQAAVGDYESDPGLCADGTTRRRAPPASGCCRSSTTTGRGRTRTSLRHTAFDVDYALGVLRGCYEGWVT